MRPTVQFSSVRFITVDLVQKRDPQFVIIYDTHTHTHTHTEREREREREAYIIYRDMNILRRIMLYTCAVAGQSVIVCSAKIYPLTIYALT